MSSGTGGFTGSSCTVGLTGSSCTICTRCTFGVAGTIEITGATDTFGITDVSDISSTLDVEGSVVRLIRRKAFNRQGDEILWMATMKVTEPRSKRHERAECVRVKLLAWSVWMLMLMTLLLFRVPVQVSMQAVTARLRFFTRVPSSSQIESAGLGEVWRPRRW